MTKKQLPTFIAVTDSLNQLGISYSAAEAHGLICGFICRDTQHGGSKRWSQCLFDEGEVDDQLQQLFTASHTQFLEEHFSLQLLLPPDQELNIDERVKALAEWCHGFLSGFGLATTTEKSKNKQVVLQEALKDIAEISRAEYHDIEVDEDSEISYTELVEYVRMAVLFIFTELRLTSKADKVST